jgi:hypothetical protein
MLDSPMPFLITSFAMLAATVLLALVWFDATGTAGRRRP